MKSEVGYLFAFMGIFCLPGFVALGYGLLSARRSMLASTWPTARGVIAKVNLEQSSGGGDGSTVYGVRMRYRYTVDGVAYEGSRIAFGYGSLRPGKAFGVLPLGWDPSWDSVPLDIFDVVVWLLHRIYLSLLFHIRVG
jgi:hypothetical protein